MAKWSMVKTEHEGKNTNGAAKYKSKFLLTENRLEAMSRQSLK